MARLLKVFLVFLTLGCSGMRARSSTERDSRNILFTEVDKAELMDAFKQVFTNDSFAVASNADSKPAWMKANMEKLEKGSPFPKHYFRPGLSYEIWAHFIPDKDRRFTVRLSIQRIEHLQLGGERGEEIRDDTYYRGTITKVMRELNKKGWKGTAN